MPLYIVGTPWNSVILSRSMISSAFSASKRGIMDTMAWACTAPLSVHVWPKLWNSGSAPSSLSSLEISPRWSAATVQFLYMFEWVSSAPLGWPVVPDVYRITAVSSGSRSSSTWAGSSTSPSSFSNSPGLTRMHSTPASSAPLVAGSSKSPQATSSLAPGSSR